MKTRLIAFLIIAFGLIFIQKNLVGWWFFGDKVIRQATKAEGDSDETQIYKKSLNSLNTIFNTIYKTGESIIGTNAGFKKYKKQKDDILKSSANTQIKFGKISVLFNYLYLAIANTNGVKTNPKFKSIIKKTPDQLKDKILDLGANPIEIQNIINSAAVSMGVSNWDKMVDNVKEIARE